MFWLPPFPLPHRFRAFGVSAAIGRARLEKKNLIRPGLSAVFPDRLVLRVHTMLKKMRRGGLPGGGGGGGRGCGCGRPPSPAWAADLAFPRTKVQKREP